MSVTTPTLKDHEMNTRRLIRAAILATLGTPLVAAASPAHHDPAYVYAPLSSWQAIQGGMRAESSTSEQATVAASYPLASYSAANPRVDSPRKQDVSPRNGNAKETTYALSSYPTTDRG